MQSLHGLEPHVDPGSKRPTVPARLSKVWLTAMTGEHSVAPYPSRITQPDLPHISRVCSRTRSAPATTTRTLSRSPASAARAQP